MVAIERGAIRNREFARQLKDFTGLQFGRITPTDIDGFVEFGDRLFVFIELKHAGALMSNGQRLALERLADAIGESGRTSLLLIAEHEAENDIDASRCRVIRYRYRGQWHIPRHSTSVRECIDAMRRMGS